MSKITIVQLAEALKKIWPIDNVNYPRLNEVPVTSRTDFLRDHVLKDVVDVVGDLGRRCGKRDHNPTIPDDKLTPVALLIVEKLIMNALQLARIEGITPGEIEQGLRTRFRLNS